jgi:hypothetical protein
MATPVPDPDGPLIPMPELTPEALRRAVTRIIPSRIHVFDEHLAEAATNAQQLQSLAPLRTFIHIWATRVAIARHPARAARLDHLEALIKAGDEASLAAMDEINRIHRSAEVEAGL